MSTGEDRARKPIRETIAPRTGLDGRPPPQETEEMAPVIIQLLREGLTDSEVAKRLGVDRKTVSRYRKKSDIVIQKNRFGRISGSEAMRADAEMMRLYNEGLTYLQIAEEVGLSYETVRSRLTKAYSSYFESVRDSVAGRQYADLQVLKNELLELILRDHMEDLQAVSDEEYGIDAEDSNAIRSLIEKAFQRGRKNTDTKLMAMDRYLKVLDREAKLFGIDQTNVNVNVQHSVAPEAIELLDRLEKVRKQDPDIIEGEVVEPLQLGNM